MQVKIIFVWFYNSQSAVWSCAVTKWFAAWLRVWIRGMTRVILFGSYFRLLLKEIITVPLFSKKYWWVFANWTTSSPSYTTRFVARVKKESLSCDGHLQNGKECLKSTRKLSEKHKEMLGSDLRWNTIPCAGVLEILIGQLL